MENKKDQEFEQDDIVNLEQFQVGRAPEEEKQHDDQDESEYTEDEVPFADGEGTQLDEELGEDNADQDEDTDADTLADEDEDDQ
ncbi:MAG: hypothetical protein EOO20_12675 [Chryseobacterium sp.]|nr:MAG: hypothetical protein EOO20_12675 [Chryseobacterium sp.]